MRASPTWNKCLVRSRSAKIFGCAPRDRDPLGHNHFGSSFLNPVGRQQVSSYLRNHSTSRRREVFWMVHVTVSLCAAIPLPHKDFDLEVIPRGLNRFVTLETKQSHSVLLHIALCRKAFEETDIRFVLKPLPLFAIRSRTLNCAKVPVFPPHSQSKQCHRPVLLED